MSLPDLVSFDRIWIHAVCKIRIRPKIPYQIQSRILQYYRLIKVFRLDLDSSFIHKKRIQVFFKENRTRTQLSRTLFVIPWYPLIRVLGSDLDSKYPDPNFHLTFCIQHLSAMLVIMLSPVCRRNFFMRKVQKNMWLAFPSQIQNKTHQFKAEDPPFFYLIQIRRKFQKSRSRFDFNPNHIGTVLTRDIFLVVLNLALNTSTFIFFWIYIIFFLLNLNYK